MSPSSQVRSHRSSQRTPDKNNGYAFDPLNPAQKVYEMGEGVDGKNYLTNQSVDADDMSEIGSIESNPEATDGLLELPTDEQAESASDDGVGEDVSTTNEPEEIEPVTDPVVEQQNAQKALAEERRFVRREAAERVALHLPELYQMIEEDKAKLAKRNEKRKAEAQRELPFSAANTVRNLLREKNIVPDELLQDREEMSRSELIAILQSAKSIDRETQDRVRAREAELAARAQQQQAEPTQSNELDDELSDEYKAKRAEAKARYDRNQSIADLVKLDGVGGIHVPKGSGKASGRYVGEDEASLLVAFQDDIRDGTAERQQQNELFERSKKITPAIDAIEAALAAEQDAIQNDTKTEVEVIRAALVAAGVYGTDTARLVGNSSDDEIKTLYSYSRDNRTTGTSTQGTVSQPIILVQPQQVTPTTQPNGQGPITLIQPQQGSQSQHAPGQGPITLVQPQSGALTTQHTGQGPITLVQPQGPPSANSQPTNPNTLTPAQELLEKQIELEAARTEWAKYSAKRHRRVIFGLFLRRSSKYKAGEENYQRLSRDVAKRELADTLTAIDQDQTLSEQERITQKRAAVDLHWINEQNNVREEATKFVEDRRWWKVVNGVSGWMNKGSKKARFGKRALVGLTLGSAAGVAGFFTFGAGTAGAAALLVTTRFGNAKLRNTTGGIGKLTAEQESALKNERMGLGTRTDNDILANRADSFANTYAKDSEKQRTKRVVAVGKSALTAAIGFGAGLVAEEAVHLGHDYFFGDTAAAQTTPPAGADGGGGGGDTAAGDGGGPGVGTGTGEAIVPPTPELHDLLNPGGVYTVSPGEGWYETFRDMGIPQENWTNVLNEAGPKLQEIGAAYLDNASGEWYIAQPGDLSTQTIQTIADSSAKFGYAFNKIG